MDRLNAIRLEKSTTLRGKVFYMFTTRCADNYIIIFLTLGTYNPQGD